MAQTNLGLQHIQFHYFWNQLSYNVSELAATKRQTHTAEMQLARNKSDFFSWSLVALFLPKSTVITSLAHGPDVASTQTLILSLTMPPFRY